MARQRASRATASLIAPARGGNGRGRAASHGPPSFEAAHLAHLQRAAGNRAVSQLVGASTACLRPDARAPSHAALGVIGSTVVQRAPGRRGGKEIAAPGTGWDGMQGLPLARELTPEMTPIVSEFRTRLEATRNDRSTWARDAGTITANFAGTARERVMLYAELQRQMMQVHRTWAAVHNLGADGSHIFIAREREMFFVVSRDGRCGTGLLEHLRGPEASRVVIPDRLRWLNGPPAKPTPAPTTPKARTVKGEVNVKPPGPEGRGGGVTPITTPEPAVRAAERRATLGAGAMMLLSMQLGNVRNAERNKALAKLQALEPRIEELRGKGFGVTVRLVVQIPEQIDIAAIWAGIGDVGQVVWFHDMFISHAGPPPKPRPAGSVPPGREPDQLRQNEAIGDRDHRKEWYREHPRRGFRFATSDLHLLPHGGVGGTSPAKAYPILVMRPDRIVQHATFGKDGPTDTTRRINISKHGGFQMWHTLSGHQYRREDAPRSGEGSFPREAKFVHPAADDKHRVWSTFEYPNGIKEIDERAEFVALDFPAQTPTYGRIHWVLDHVVWRNLG